MTKSGSVRGGGSDTPALPDWLQQVSDGYDQAQAEKKQVRGEDRTPTFSELAKANPDAFRGTEFKPLMTSEQRVAALSHQGRSPWNPTMGFAHVSGTHVARAPSHTSSRTASSDPPQIAGAYGTHGSGGGNPSVDYDYIARGARFFARG